MTTHERLIQASHAALAGPNPADAFRAWDLDIADVATFATAWTAELMQKAEETGQELTVEQIVVGALAVGIQLGRSQERAN